MKNWTCGSSPPSGSRNAWIWIKDINGSSRLSKFWNLIGAIHMISCIDCWSWKKICYIIMTQGQSNKEWCGGKISEIKSPGRILASIFLVSRRHPPHWLSFKGPNYQRGVLLISVGAIVYFELKTPREFYQGNLFLAWQCPGSPGNCKTDETGLSGLPISLLPTLLSVSGPIGLPPVPYTENKNWKFAIFRPTHKILNLCLSGLQKLEQQTKKCIEIRGECVE
jgi:hypothetical protein